jgi:hypothetical protein
LPIKEKIIADGFDPLINTVYEFYGDYWHGNPRDKRGPNHLNKKKGQTFKELYEKTILREKILLSYGYKLITIWEMDWDIEQKEIKRKLKEQEKLCK